MTPELIQIPDADYCQCCDFGNHTETCTCKATRECCHPEYHGNHRAAWSSYDAR
jgi:hypothetical protein